MTYKVFHYEGPHLTSFSERAFADWPLHYRFVASVEAEALGHVYQLTNHFNEPWTDGAAVTLTPLDAKKLADARALNPRVNSSMVLEMRSTSVGDVIIDPIGGAHGVAGSGFTALDPLTPLVKAKIEAVRAAHRSGDLTSHEAFNRINDLLDAKSDVIRASGLFGADTVRRTGTGAK